MLSKKLKGKNVLITGGAGFIGANLIHRLIMEEANITLILRPDSKTWRLKDVTKKVRIAKADLLDSNKIKKIVKSSKPNYIYHLAAHGAYSYQDNAEKILQTNIFGTLNLINAAKAAGFDLFVNTGSSSEYGFKEKPMKETDILVPNSYYAVAKATQTHLCSHVGVTDNLPLVTLRPFSVYGPYEEPGRLIPNMMKAFYNNDTLSMVSKSIVRDFIFVDDYVDACLKINQLNKNPGEIFNIGSGKEINFAKLIRTFQKIVKDKGKVEWKVAPGKKWDTNHWKADISKTNTILKFKPKYSIEKGLQKSWEWFKTNHQLYE